MRDLTLVLVLAVLSASSFAADLPLRSPKPLPAGKSPAPAAQVTAVRAVGAGQAGFVHYFLITHPDGDLEYQVGVELEDQRIAWSFPGAGVMVSEYIKKGELEVAAKTYKIEHLYGIRPFRGDADMRALQRALPRRVAYWIDSKTPYCLLRQPGESFCLSCGDFVVRILYPGPHPLIPSLPADFLRATGTAYTTDDLLLYLVGLYNLPDRRSMLAKLDTLSLPAVMREDVIYMIKGNENEPLPPLAAPAMPAPAVAQKPAENPPVRGKIATRRQNAKRL